MYLLKTGEKDSRLGGGVGGWGGGGWGAGGRGVGRVGGWGGGGAGWVGWGGGGGVVSCRSFLRGRKRWGKNLLCFEAGSPVIFCSVSRNVPTVLLSVPWSTRVGKRLSRSIGHGD